MKERNWRGTKLKHCHVIMFKLNRVAKSNSLSLPLPPPTSFDTMPSHVPATSIDDLRALRKRQAVNAYEQESTYYINIGKKMPKLDDEHREDVELAVADMEQQQVRGGPF